jgi:hypothetical protein
MSTFLNLGMVLKLGLPHGHSGFYWHFGCTLMYLRILGALLKDSKEVLTCDSTILGSELRPTASLHLFRLRFEPLIIARLSAAQGSQIARQQKQWIDNVFPSFQLGGNQKSRPRVLRLQVVLLV